MWLVILVLFSTLLLVAEISAHTMPRTVLWCVAPPSGLHAGRGEESELYSNLLVRTAADDAGRHGLGEGQARG